MNGVPEKIDYSKPPPGFYPPSVGAQRNYEPFHHSNQTQDHVPMLLPKNESTPVPHYSNQINQAVDLRHSYYQAAQGSNARPSNASQARLRNQDHSAAAYTSQPPPLPPSRPHNQDHSKSAYSVPPPPISSVSVMPVTPVVYNKPPPVSLMHAYPANIQMAPNLQHMMNNSGYAVPSAAGAGLMGAGQYVSQQPGNVHPPQYHGEYSARHSNRGGFNNFSRKRNMPPEFDPAKRGISKKKKKPLSQNMPSKKDWTLEDAKRALDVERDYNKRHKSPSLIIKFPDPEINKEKVMKYHPNIENVHFQQSFTPRYCFVTLRAGSCINQIMRDLEKIKHGQGYLSVEPKNNKDDDFVKGPEDIDPTTLYVGNLAQEVTVDNVAKLYQKHKRIDIGFAKKMKYTRYAFVCFRTPDDAIQAFQKTHNTEMYNKSLIVRFRRLHGTVGLPGDPKPQNSQKRSDIESSKTFDDTSAKNFDQEDKAKQNPPEEEIVADPSTNTRSITPIVSCDKTQEPLVDVQLDNRDAEAIIREFTDSERCALAVSVKRELIDCELTGASPANSSEPQIKEESLLGSSDSTSPVKTESIRFDVESTQSNTKQTRSTNESIQFNTESIRSNAESTRCNIESSWFNNKNPVRIKEEPADDEEEEPVDLENCVKAEVRPDSDEDSSHAVDYDSDYDPVHGVF